MNDNRVYTEGRGPIPSRACRAIFLLSAALVSAELFAATQPTGLSVSHRSGQSFVTWAERAEVSGERYRVYRHTSAITAGNLPQSDMLFELAEGSCRFYADRFLSGESWAPRYLDRMVVSDGGEPLGEGTGLLVWTLSAQDFGGASSGDGWYAVTTVDAQGQENRADFSSGNSVGPVAESVSPPLPVEISASVGPGGHVFLQYMDVRGWNTTFHAPNPSNAWYGLDPGDASVAGSAQYAYNYAVYEPDLYCGGETPPRAPVIVSLHGWGGNQYPPLTEIPDPWWCAFKIYPVDVSETWWFGFARSHDYREGGSPQAGDVVVNYTEQRVLRMVYDLLRHPVYGPRTDPDRVYVYGSSMGGSGALALALRYPGVFAAAYASEPMTDYASSGDGGGTDWRGDVAPKWGAPGLNLPVRSDGVGGAADHLKKYDGTGVWDWQDHQENLAARRGDPMVPFGVGHGRADTVIEWSTQGSPAYAAFDTSLQCWGGAVTDDPHTWLSFQGLPPPLDVDSSLTPFSGLRVVLDESVPGLSRSSGNIPIPPDRVGGYNMNVEWSSSWNPWDGPPSDTASQWRVSLRTTDGSSLQADVTPRRLQQFPVTPGGTYSWENRRVSDNGLVGTGTIPVSAEGVLTVPGFSVTPGGNRLLLWKKSQGNVHPVAVCAVLPSSGTAPLTVQADGSASYDTDGRITSYSWEFGDGGVAVGPVASHVYSAPGVYQATLTVTDDAGATDRATSEIRVSVVQNARKWPDTTRGIHVFNDQFPPNMPDALVRFCALNYAGTQKMTRVEADRLRGVNPSFLILHYRLGLGLGYRSAEGDCQPTGDLLRIIRGDDWIVEWPGDSSVAEGWFFHWPEDSSQRVYQCDWGWYLMELGDPGWRAWWHDTAWDQVQANDDDGTFMDSLSVPNFLGGSTYRPQLPDFDPDLESAWAARISDWLSWLRTRPLGSRYIVPNVGSWITSRDATDYTAADGVMVEGFAMEADQSPYALSDWQLQMNRVLSVVRGGGAVLAQTYVAGVQERMFSLASYLLVKGGRTFVNVDVGSDPEWWPEYGLPVGAPSAATPQDIQELDPDGDYVYRREYDTGAVLVNPTSPYDGSGVTRTVQLGGEFWTAAPSGGGIVPPDGAPTGGLSWTAVTSVTLAPNTSAILFRDGAIRGTGDLNGDGRSDVLDAVILDLFIGGVLRAGPPPFTAPEPAADIDRNGAVNAADLALLMARFAS